MWLKQECFGPNEVREEKLTDSLRGSGEAAFAI